MKPRSYRLFLVIISASLFAFIPISLCFSSPMDCGGRCSFPCWDPCLLGVFEVGGEFLWWKPSLDIKRVILEERKNENDTTHTRKSLCPDWEPGKRFWIYKPFPSLGGCGFGASWSAICHDYSISDKIKDGGIGVFSIPCRHLPMSSFSKVDTSWKISYQDYNALFSYSCYWGQSFVLHPFFGFTGLAIEEKLRVVGQPCDSEESQVTTECKTCLYAYGVRIGSRYECPFFRHFSVFGRASLSLLAGRPRIHSQTGGHHHKKRVIPHCYPNCHLAAGISYNPVFCYGSFSFRAGYELMEWFYLPRSPHFLVDKNLESTNNQALGWQGLFAGVNISF